MYAGSKNRLKKAFRVITYMDKQILTAKCSSLTNIFEHFFLHNFMNMLIIQLLNFKN